MLYTNIFYLIILIFKFVLFAYFTLVFLMANKILGQEDIFYEEFSEAVMKINSLYTTEYKNTFWILHVFLYIIFYLINNFSHYLYINSQPSKTPSNPIENAIFLGRPKSPEISDFRLIVCHCEPTQTSARGRQYESGLITFCFGRSSPYVEEEEGPKVPLAINKTRQTN